METITSLKKKIAELKRQNLALSQRFEKVAHLEPFAPASVEFQIMRLVGGKLTPGLAAHDIVCANGKKLEVKFSGLNAPNPVTLRWQWGHPLGIGGNKKFDRLILVGKIDSRYARLYREPKSPYVIFDVPFRSVRDVKRKDEIIQITTNPEVITSDAAKLLFRRFQTTRRELSDRHKVA